MLEKVKEGKEKIVKGFNYLYFTLLMFFIKANNVFASESVSISGNGGEIRNSALGNGVFKLANDISGTLRWLIPVVSIPFILWDLFKMFAGDEQEQPRYKKRLITTLIIIMTSTMVTVIINTILKYFNA